MKIRVTKKAMRDSGNKIYSVGYCGLQNLLQYKSPFAYSCGTYGWSCDYYMVGDFIISTGYTPIGEPLPYGFTQKYDKEAGKIFFESGLPWQQRDKKLEKLFKKMVKEIKGGVYDEN